MSIEVAGPATNKGILGMKAAKKVIFDLPSILKNGERADAEIQVAAQEFILHRTDIYGANILVLQYSAEDGQTKSEVRIPDVPGALVVVFMRHSPKVFED